MTNEQRLERAQSELAERHAQIAEREYNINKYNVMLESVRVNYPEDTDMQAHAVHLEKLIAGETRQMKMEILARDALIAQID